MTKEEFKETAFSKNLKVIYSGETYPLIGVDFLTGKVAIRFHADGDLKWISWREIEIN